MSTDIKTYCTTLRDLVGDEDPLAILAGTPSRIQALITGREAAVLRTRPRPDKWSISEIVAHLADSELVFGFRLRMIFTVNGTSLQAFDPDAWASTFAYGRCDVHESADLFASLRTGNLRMLRLVADPLTDNTGTHEEWGTETARSIIRLEAGHDKNHLAQIERLLGSAAANPPSTPGEQR